jgi:hypothetical protein
MYIERVMAVFNFSTPAPVQAFINSEDVRREKFGSPPGPATSPLQPVHLIQPDNFQITAFGAQIQVNYALPNDYRDLEDDPFVHLGSRFNRLTKALQAVAEGGVNWVGIQVFFADPVKEANSAREALGIWLKHIGKHIFGSFDPVSVNLTFGEENNGLFETVTMQAYENRSAVINLQQGAPPPPFFDLERSTVVREAGIQFVIDVNSRPMQGKMDVDQGFATIMRTMVSRHKTLIERATDLVAGRMANG